MSTSADGPSGSEFKISSFCHLGGCVGVAVLPDRSRLMIDTKEVDGYAVHFTEQEWSAFVAGVKSGEFDYWPRSA